MTMAATATDRADADAALGCFLRGYSTEVTARDRRSIEAARDLLPRGSEVFIAAIPGESEDRLVAAAVALRAAGMVPVPHIVARNIESRKGLEDLVGRLTGEAGLDRALVLGGDRDNPAGAFDSSLQLLQTGVFQRYDIRRVFLGCYPEGHPRVADSVLEDARAAKLKLADEFGFDVTLISQFCFDAAPVLALARRMRSLGVTVPFRVGVAGPAARATLIRYALMCGVGASMRGLRQRHALARNLLSGETPEALLTEVALAQAAEPGLGLSGVHFFTFGALARSARFALEHSRKSPLP